MAAKLLRLANEIESDRSFTESRKGDNERSKPTQKVHAELNRELVLGAVTRFYRARRLRDRYFPQDLFGEPGWDLLLDLFSAKLQDRKISVTSACVAADVPPTTALRWLGLLESCGLVKREDHKHDHRVSWVQLTDTAADSMFRLFEEIAERSLNIDPNLDRYLMVEELDHG
jgi:hypothetical protein